MVTMSQSAPPASSDTSESSVLSVSRLSCFFLACPIGETYDRGDAMEIDRGRAVD